MDDQYMKSKKTVIISAAFIFLPAILFFVISLVQCGRSGGGLFLPVPKWNDEAAYYALIKTWLSTGMPKGYWGFEGGHAILGTGSAWSPAILFPYAVFGEMFGWGYGSVAVANVVFLCISNAIILILCKPNARGIVYLLLVEAFSGHILLYLNTIMSEVLRYALAMVLAAMLYRLLFGEENERDRVFRYVVVPVYIVVITQIYIFFAFAVPVYIISIMKNKKWYCKAITAFLAMGVEAGGSYYLLHLISSNYNIYKTEILFEALKSKDIFGAVKTFLWMFKVGLIDLWHCFLSYTGHGMFRWFVPLLAVFAVLPLLVLCADRIGYLKRKEKEQGVFWNRDRQIFLVISYSVGLFVLMYITLYSLEAFTFYRGVGIVLLFSLVMALGMEKKKYGYLFLALYAAGISFVPANQADFNGERYVSAEVRDEWDTLAKELERAMPLEEENEMLYEVQLPERGRGPESGEMAYDSSEAEEKAGQMSETEERRWANTAVLYSMEPKLICAIPAGIGVNFAMYSDEIVEEAGYLVFSLKEEDLRQDWLEQSHQEIYEKYGGILERDYFIQYMDEEYIVYRKRRGNERWSG